MSLDQWISQVFDTNSFIHIFKDVLGALIPTFIIGRKPWTQQSTFHHWSLIGGFPLCSKATNLFTHWDSCSVLDAIILIDGFLDFIYNLPYWLLFKGSFSCTACIWHMRKTHMVSSWTCSLSDFLQIIKLLLSTSCWMMRDVLMLYFQRVSFHRLQLIYSGDDT